MIEAEDGGLFRSRDGGTSWEKTSEDRSLRQRAWYYTRVYADPGDEDSVYVLNVRLHFSKDGGKTFVEIDTPHSDNHDLWIDPADPERMIEANDGGANVSYNRGLTWSAQSNQPTAQFYRVSTDNAFPYRLLGGQQDNSAVRVRSRSFSGDRIGRRDWEPTAGGESGHIVAKPDEPDIVVGGSYGGLLRLVDHRTGAMRSIDVWPDNPMGWGAGDLEYRFQWNFPILFSRHDPDVLLVAANVLFRSADLGQSWTRISPDLTRNDKSRMGKSGGPITKDDTGVEYYGTVFAVAESQHQAGVIWAGSDDGRVHLTRDGGDHWSDVTPARLPEWALVNSIDIDPFNPAGAYLAATRYKLDDFQPYLYHSTDWGRSWKRIDGGLPERHFTRVLRADPAQAGLLYTGTERGIYYSVNNGRKWSSLQLDLPVAPITDLQVKGDDLVAATQGRGFWILDDLAVLRQQAAGLALNRMQLYTPEPALRLIAGRRNDDPGTAGTNPYDGVSLFYHLPAQVRDPDSLSLAVYGENDEAPIWTWTVQDENENEDDSAETGSDEDEAVLASDAGLHRHVWDLRYPGMKRFEGLVLWADMESGPTAVPGAYRARLSADGKSVDTSFDVIPDPRSAATPEDYAAQFTFVRDIRDLLTRTHEEIERIRSVRARLDSLKARLDKDTQAALLDAVDAIGATITAVEEALYQTQNQSPQDPLNFPIRLNDKLASLMRTVAQDDHRPTRQAMAVKEALSEAAETELARLNAVWDAEIPALNEAVRDAGLTMIAVPRG